MPTSKMINRNEEMICLLREMFCISAVLWLFPSLFRSINANSWRSNGSRSGCRDSCSRSMPTWCLCSSSRTRSRSFTTTTKTWSLTTSLIGPERYQCGIDLRHLHGGVQLNFIFTVRFQVEERSKLNRQGSPKICTTVSDTNIQSRADSISQSGSVQSAQTPPMQRPVEPQGGQSKVCVYCENTTFSFLPLNSSAALPLTLCFFFLFHVCFHFAPSFKKNLLQTQTQLCTLPLCDVFLRSHSAAPPSRSSAVSDGSLGSFKALRCPCSSLSVPLWPAH